MWGNWSFYAVAVGAAISCLGALNGFTLITAQVSLASAQDKLFPARFAQTSAAGVPAFGLIVPAVLVSAMLVFNYSGSQGAVAIFKFIILLATLTTLLPYAFCAMAELIVFFTDRERFSGQRLRGSIIVAVLAFIYSIVAIVGSGATTVLWGLVLMLLGLPVYVWMRRDQADQAARQPSRGFLRDRVS
jgi:APA family basic amino acid/polyamine antiporter